MTAAGLTAAWAARTEGGAALPLRLLLSLVLRLGPRAANLVLPPITAWHLLNASQARAASRGYLSRVLPRKPRLADTARHFQSFAACLLDRVFLLSGRDAAYDVGIEGLDPIVQAVTSGQGVVLLGSHLGSFEVLRRIGRAAPVAVRPVMYRRNAGALTAILDRLAPDLAASIIDIGDPASMLRAHQAVAAGEIVGLLADRSPGGERGIRVPFLGADAAFPAGPFLLAASLPAPVFLFFGLRTGPRRYTIRFLPFADRLVLPRASRAEALRCVVTRYAKALEAACRDAPFNWFNFYDFWEATPDQTPLPAALGRPAGLPPAGLPLGGGAAGTA